MLFALGRHVFEPGYQGLRRAIGHPSAPVTAEAFIAIARTRLTAITDLAAGRISDEAFNQARASHLFFYAEYAATWRTLDKASPPGMHLYGPVTAEDTIANCCGHFLSTLGAEILYPADAERHRIARTGMRRPALPDLGLTAEQIRAENAQRQHGEVVCTASAAIAVTKSEQA